MGHIECPYCERRCRLDDGAIGLCRMYQAHAGAVVERFPARYSSMSVSHIESVPFYHYQPGSRTLVLGGAGCNFDCEYCANAYVARAEPDDLMAYHLPAQKVVDLANRYGCHSLSFAVNEPTVAMPTLLELAGDAAKAGLPLGALTNGYMTADAAEAMGKAFSFVNVSLKAMSAAFYRQHVGVGDASAVMRNIEILRRRTHVEVSTPIVQGLNDGDIPAIAEFLAGLDAGMAWHVFRLLPEYKMADRERPSIEEVNAALRSARQRLPFIYFGNFVGSQWVSTICPTCGATAIERVNMGGCTSKLRSCRLEGDRCAACGNPLPVAGGCVDWHSRDHMERTRDGATWKSA